MKNTKMSRRDMLKASACIVSGLALAACAPTAPQPAAAATSQPVATTVPAKTTAPVASGCAVTAPGTFPVVKDKVELTIMMVQSPLVKDMATNELTLEYEQKTNVHINWQMVPQQGLVEKRNLVLAGGTLPDIMMGMAIPREDQALYGQQGIFIPLNDLIEKHTVWTKEKYNTVPGLKDALTAPDGKIYSLGGDNQAQHPIYKQKMWINRKWVEKVGMKMPTTTDEFYQVLKAFKEKDPNGNGKADEIPLIGNTPPGTSSSVTGFVMCAFIYDDSEMRLILENGKIVPIFNKAEFKEGLAFLRKLYAEKLLDPQSFTLTSDADLRKLGENEAAQILGAFAGLQPGTAHSLAATRHKDYEPLPPLKGPKGVQTTGYYPYTASIGTYSITKACKCPDVAMRWIDWFHDSEGGVRSRIGREGFEWRKAKPDELGLDGKPADWIKMTAINEQQNFFWGQVTIPQMFVHSRQGTDPDPYAATGLEGRLYKATELYKPYKPAEIVPPLWIAKADLSRYAQLQTEVNTFVNQMMARYISGDVNLDTDWDNYVKQLDKMGLPEYLTILQKAYDSKVKK